MPKFRSAVCVSAISLLLLVLAAGLGSAQERAKSRAVEGHVPRTRTAQKSEAADRDADGEAGDRENPRGREQWFLQGRLHNGRPATELLIKAHQQRETMRLQAFRARQLKDASRALKPADSGTGSTGWTELGPSPLRSVTTTGDNQDYGYVTGRVTAVAVDQSDPSGNTVYIGGAYGGVWKSTTAANPDPTKVVWTPIADDQPTLAIGAIAVDPGDNNVVLVGTGEANSSTDSYYGLGILRSTDAGNSWTLITSANGGLRPFHGLAFAKFAFKSDNPNIVVAATAAASEGITVGAEQPPNNTVECANPSMTVTCRGLYYSYDSGQTWSQVTMSDGSGTPDNGSASDVIYNPQEQKFYAWSRAHGLYTSTDGINFTRAADQGTPSAMVIQPAGGINIVNCPSAVNLTTCPIYRGQITQVPGRDEMYVWFVDSSTTPVDGGIYETLDGGKTWTTINRSAIESCGDSTGCGTEQGDYNLVLTAVPNGGGTDLYAGAINIYRCQVSASNPTCSAKPFINLTHVYGCTPTGSFSKVHPDEHSFDFLQSNPNIIYFGNDGGVYRTLSGLSVAAGSVPSSCPGSAPSAPFYPFDNLNGTMGSMTQFVWFQQHPTDQFTLLGGTQDNGSPAIDSANSGTNGITWRSVLAGDGGWTDINPSNVNEWFTENTVLNPGIQRCESGTACTDSAFAANVVVNSATVGGDSASFYMPFMLDPQKSSQILLGTCRVWRVPSSGVSPPSNSLSPNFDGSSGSCASTSTSFVNALAAGGPKTTNGSQVIYAGTLDGHVWTTQAADGGSGSWSDASPVPGGFAESPCTSGSCQYPVSGIAIDPRDASGKTAYVTAMGFGIGHVWQTTNGGGTWVDISGTIGSGGLPDSPADGVAIDASTGTIYTATDVGVFSTAMASGSTTQWTEVGPATGPGTLPNVAATRIAIFNPAGLPPRLRVSTYGRGIWEMPLPGSTVPDYALAISNTDLETFPGESVTYNGLETTYNGYSGTVNLNCNAAGGALPASCSASGISGGMFTVNADDTTVQDFSFRVQGSDGMLVRQAAVTLRVVDFAIATPSPSSITIIHGNNQTVQVGVTSMGSFDQIVTIDCDPATVPPGMTCAATAVTPPAGGTIPVTVTIGTTTATPVGSYTPTIRAASTIDASHTALHMQTMQVQVTAASGFAFDTTTYTKQILKVGQTLTANVNLVPHDSYSGTVNLTCSAAGATSCLVSPPSVPYAGAGTGSTTPVSATVITTGETAGPQQVSINAADGNPADAQQVMLPFSLTDFGVGVGVQPGNGTPGSGVSFSIQLTPINGYNSQVTLSCDTGSLGVPCTFSPASPTLTPGATTVVNASLTIPTTASAGSYTATVTATDATFAGLIHSKATSSFAVEVNPDFSFSFGASNVTAKAGGTIAPIPLTIAATGGFNGSISWGVSNCPQLATCSVTPNPSTPSQTASLMIATTAPSVSSVRRESGKYLALWIGLPFGVMGMLVVRRRKTLGMVALLMLLGLGACGGGGGGSGGGSTPPVTNPGTPSGTYNIVVTGTAGTTVHQQTFVLTVQ